MKFHNTCSYSVCWNTALTLVQNNILQISQFIKTLYNSSLYLLQSLEQLSSQLALPPRSLGSIFCFNTKQKFLLPFVEFSLKIISFLEFLFLEGLLGILLKFSAFRPLQFLHQASLRQQLQ